MLAGGCPHTIDSPIGIIPKSDRGVRFSQLTIILLTFKNMNVSQWMMFSSHRRYPTGNSHRFSLYHLVN